MTTPTEGVKLEEAVARIIDPTAFRTFATGVSAVPAWRTNDALAKADAILALVSSPQAAKRIEELEAEAARLQSELLGREEQLDRDDDDLGTLEARALKAEHQRDEAVAALEKAAEEARRYAGFYPQSSDGRNTFIIFAEAVEAARSVLTSIREG